MNILFEAELSLLKFTFEKNNFLAKKASLDIFGGAAVIKGLF